MYVIDKNEMSVDTHSQYSLTGSIRCDELYQVWLM